MCGDQYNFGNAELQSAGVALRWCRAADNRKSDILCELLDVHFKEICLEVSVDPLECYMK